MRGMLGVGVVVLSLVAVGCKSSAGVSVGGGSGPTVSNPFKGGTVEVAQLPATVEAFTAWRNQVATSPEGAAAVYVVAQLTYSKDQDLGLKFLTIALDQHFLTSGTKGVKGREPTRIVQSRIKERIKARPYVARSYFQGTTPENGYALPAAGLEIQYTEVRDQGERAKVFVVSTGADSARPITVQQNNRGVWKAWEWSSLEVGVRPPVKVVDDDL
jgi:hypothetical protein